MSQLKYLKCTVDAVLRRSPAQPFFRWRASRRLIVLAYHDVTDPETFAYHVDYLRMRMHPVSLAEVADALRTERGLPRRAVLITFDDGDRTVYEEALPILRDRGIPAVVFIVAGLVGTDKPFWWREVEDLVRRGASVPELPSDAAACVRSLKGLRNEVRLAYIHALRRSAVISPPAMPQLTSSEILVLDRAGISIGNHTLTHPCLDRCTEGTLRSEIILAHDAITAILGKEPIAFAYPNGTVDQRAVPVLADLRYDAAFMFDHRIGKFPPPDPYRISRVRMDSDTPPDRFHIVLSGLHSSVHRLLGRS